MSGIGSCRGVVSGGFMGLVDSIDDLAVAPPFNGPFFAFDEKRLVLFLGAFGLFDAARELEACLRFLFAAMGQKFSRFALPQVVRLFGFLVCHDWSSM